MGKKKMKKNELLAGIKAEAFTAVVDAAITGPLETARR